MSDLVVKTNWLNQALQNLSLLEIRIIQLAIVDARESGTGLSPDKPLTIHSKRYADVFGVQAKNAYANIKEAEDTLFKRQFTLTDDDGKPVKSRWVQDVKYLDNQGAIEMCFTRHVVKGISRIDGAIDFFTQYLLSNTINFKSVYSVRLYELLKQWEKGDPKKMPMFELQTLRGQLGVAESEYTRMYDFKKYVLDKAISEIDKHSDLTVSYTQRKKGRVIIGFDFKIKSKPKEKHFTNRTPDTVDMFSPMTDKQRLFFANKLSKLHELSHLAIGQAKLSYPAFAEQIASDLLDPEKQAIYQPYLTEVGFKNIH